MNLMTLIISLFHIFSFFKKNLKCFMMLEVIPVMVSCIYKFHLDLVKGIAPN
uniref:Uncharacterized protein n=1 Tax=Rhizophora mucronata TaxID=61149 RepID=A0A2P2PK23_RHIMU